MFHCQFNAYLIFIFNIFSLRKRKRKLQRTQYATTLIPRNKVLNSSVSISHFYKKIRH